MHSAKGLRESARAIPAYMNQNLTKGVQSHE